METTVLISNILGPVLLIRGVSILLDRKHFRVMLDGLEKGARCASMLFLDLAYENSSSYRN